MVPLDTLKPSEHRNLPPKMASPANSSGLNCPLARSIRSAPAWAPAARRRVAISALETALSAVMTTRPDAASAYQAMPSTPAVLTALLTAASVSALNWGDGAAAAVDVADRPMTAVPIAIASNRPNRRWLRLGVILTDFSLRLKGESSVGHPQPSNQGRTRKFTRIICFRA